MRIIDIYDIERNNCNIPDNYRQLADERFIYSSECEKFMDAANHSEDTIKDWFSIAGVTYNKLKLTKNNVIYTVEDGSELILSDLSTGEQLVLYLLACKQNNEKIAMHGLFERLDGKMVQRIENQLIDYENLIIILYNSYEGSRLSICKVDKI